MREKSARIVHESPARFFLFFFNQMFLDKRISLSFVDRHCIISLPSIPPLHIQRLGFTKPWSDRGQLSSGPQTQITNRVLVLEISSGTVPINSSTPVIIPLRRAKSLRLSSPALISLFWDLTHQN